jgi:hypothetical protein
MLSIASRRDESPVPADDGQRPLDEAPAKEAPAGNETPDD